MAAVCLEQLGGDQSDQTQSHHDYGFSQGGIGQADALQAYRSDYCESRFLVADSLRNLCHEILWNRNVFRMRPIGRYPVAYGKLMDAFPNANHPAHIAIAKRQRLAQFIEYRIHGRL